MSSREPTPNSLAQDGLYARLAGLQFDAVAKGLVQPAMGRKGHSQVPVTAANPSIPGFVAQAPPPYWMTCAADWTALMNN